MFFPCLESLKKGKFPEQSVDIYDWWLGTRRKNTYKSLNPLQFSNDCRIDMNHAIQLFSYCVFDEKIKLLQRRYTLYCPICDHKVLSTIESIPNKSVICKNCSTEINPILLSDHITITFELLQSPQLIQDSTTPIGINSGNVYGLRVSHLQELAKEDDDIRRLYDCFRDG